MDSGPAFGEKAHPAGGFMPDVQRSAVFDRRFVRNLWRLIRIYWASPDAKRGALLLATAVALEIGTVVGSLLVAYAERRILEGLEHRDVSAFLMAVGFFFAATLTFVVAGAYRLFARQAVELRWRRGLTTHFVERWISTRCFLMEEIPGADVDNPQQRIQRTYATSSRARSDSRCRCSARSPRWFRSEGCSTTSRRRGRCRSTAPW
jgi:ABC-type uncharacterized transport system fused permease/ATPase subunit